RAPNEFFSLIRNSAPTTRRVFRWSRPFGPAAYGPPSRMILLVRCEFRRSRTLGKQKKKCRKKQTRQTVQPKPTRGKEESGTISCPKSKTTWKQKPGSHKRSNFPSDSLSSSPRPDAGIRQRDPHQAPRQNRLCG